MYSIYIYIYIYIYNYIDHIYADHICINTQAPQKPVRALALHMFFCIIYIVYKYIGTTRSQFVHWLFIRPIHLRLRLRRKPPQTTREFN